MSVCECIRYFTDRDGQNCIKIIILYPKLMKSRLKPFQQFNLSNRLVPNSQNNSAMTSSVQISSASSSSSRYDIPKYIYPECPPPQQNNNNQVNFHQEYAQQNTNMKCNTKVEVNQTRDYRFKVLNGSKSTVPIANSINNMPYLQSTGGALSSCQVANVCSPYIKSEYISSNSQSNSCKQLSPMRSQPKYETPKLHTYRSTTPDLAKQTLISDKSGNNSNINFHTQTQPKKQTILNASNISANTTPGMSSARQASQSRNQVINNNFNNQSSIFNYFNGVKRQHKDKERYQHSAPPQQNQAQFTKIVNKIKGNRDKTNQVFQSTDTIQSQQVSINSFNYISRQTSPNQRMSMVKIFQKPATSTTSNFCYYNAVSEPTASCISTSQITVDNLQQLQKKNQQQLAKIKVLQLQANAFKNTSRQWLYQQKNYKDQIQHNRLQISQLVNQKNYLTEQLSKRITAQSNEHALNMKLKQEIMQLNRKILQTKSEYYRTEQELKNKHQIVIQQYEKSAMIMREKNKQSQIKSIMDIKSQLDRYMRSTRELERKLEEEQKKNIDMVYQYDRKISKICEENKKEMEKIRNQYNLSRLNCQSLSNQLKIKQNALKQAKIGYQLQLANRSNQLSNLQAQFQRRKQQTLKQARKQYQQQISKINQQLKNKFDSQIKIIQANFNKQILVKQEHIRNLNTMKQQVKIQLQNKIRQLRDQTKQKQRIQADFSVKLQRFAKQKQIMQSDLIIKLQKLAKQKQIIQSDWAIKLQRLTKQKYEIQLKTANEIKYHINQISQANNQVFRLRQQLQLIQHRGQQKNVEIQQIYIKKISQIQKQKDDITILFQREKQALKKIQQQNLQLRSQIKQIQIIKTNDDGKLKEVQSQIEERYRKQQQLTIFYQNEIKIKQHQIAVQKQNLNLAIKQINDLRNLQQCLRKQNEQLRIDCQILNQQIQNLQNNQNILRSDLSILNNSSQQLQLLIQQLNNRIIVLTQKSTSNQAQKQTIQRMTIQLNIVKQNYDKQIQCMNIHFNNCVRQLQSQLNCQNEQIKFIQKTKDQLRSQKQELVEINSNLVQQIQLITQQNQKLKINIKQQTKQIQEINKLNIKLKQVCEKQQKLNQDKIRIQNQTNNNTVLQIKQRVNESQKMLDNILLKSQGQNEKYQQLLSHFQANSQQFKNIVSKLQIQNDQLLEQLKINNIAIKQVENTRLDGSLTEMVDYLYWSAIQKLQYSLVNQFQTKVATKLIILQQKILHLQQRIKQRQIFKTSNDSHQSNQTQNKKNIHLRNFYQGKYKQLLNLFNQQTDSSSQNNICSLPSIQMFNDKDPISITQIQDNICSIQEHEIRLQEQFNEKHKKLVSILLALMNKMQQLTHLNSQLQQQCGKQKTENTKITEQKNKIKNQNNKLLQNLGLAEQTIRTLQQQIRFKNNTIQAGQAKLRQLEYLLGRQEEMLVQVTEDFLATKLNILNLKYVDMDMDAEEEEEDGNIQITD